MRAFVLSLATALVAALASLPALAGDTPVVNDQPRMALPATQNTPPRTPLNIAGVSVSDPDVGAGTMDQEINVADHGASMLPPAQVGVFRWSFGTDVTVDSATATLTQINNGLATLQFRPAAGFAGAARLVFEIDDNGNTGTGGELAHTLFLVVNVCAAVELGTPACATNEAPVNTLPSSLPSVAPQTTVAIPASVADVDVGGGTLELELNLADAGGVLTPAQVGTFSWGFGSNVTADTATGTLAQINTGLSTLSFRSAPGFVGTARIVMEVDDNGNSGSGGERADTNVITIPVAPNAGTMRFSGGCRRRVGESALFNAEIERVVGDDGVAGTTVDDEPGSATFGSDYALAGANAVSWPDQNASARLVPYTITGDAVSEGAETFLLRLTAPSGATLGTPSVIEVTIDPAIPTDVVLSSDGFENPASCPT